MDGDEALLPGFARMYEAASPGLLARFAAPTVLFSALWAPIVDLVLFHPSAEASVEGYLATDPGIRVGVTVLLCLLSVFPAVANYAIAPGDPVDIYHRIGILFSMYVPINLVLSAGFMLGPAFGDSWYIGAYGPPLQYSFLSFIASSAFLPGPYLGVYVSTWLDRRST